MTLEPWMNLSAAIYVGFDCCLRFEIPSIILSSSQNALRLATLPGEVRCFNLPNSTDMKAWLEKWLDVAVVPIRVRKRCPRWGNPSPLDVCDKQSTTPSHQFDLHDVLNASE